MFELRRGFDEICENYLFEETRRKAREWEKNNPNVPLANLGVGDVTLPLSSEVVKGMKRAAADMGNEKRFHGYSPAFGYDFLRERIVEYYSEKQVRINKEDVFVSSGAKDDLALLFSLFSPDTVVAFCNPSYPVYGECCDIFSLKKAEIPLCFENGFLPCENGVKADVVVLCSPHNPTGVSYGKELLARWVKFAKENGSVILFDSAYCDFAKKTPFSVFEVEGAQDCAVEIKSFSKGFGFTGIRLGFVVVGDNVASGKLKKAWQRKCSTLTNGVSYVSQVAGFYALGKRGEKYKDECVERYLRLAKVLKEELMKANFEVSGGEESPYLFVRKKGIENMSSFLLEKFGILSVDGEGFGECGRGYARLSSLSGEKNVRLATERLKEFFLL